MKISNFITLFNVFLSTCIGIKILSETDKVSKYAAPCPD